MTILYECAEISEEKCQKQCADMCTIDICIGHDDDTMIAEATIVK